MSDVKIAIYDEEGMALKEREDIRDAVASVDGKFFSFSAEKASFKTPDEIIEMLKDIGIRPERWE